MIYRDADRAGAALREAQARIAALALPTLLKIKIISNRFLLLTEVENNFRWRCNFPQALTPDVRSLGHYETQSASAP